MDPPSGGNIDGDDDDDDDNVNVSLTTSTIWLLSVAVVRVRCIAYGLGLREDRRRWGRVVVVSLVRMLFSLVQDRCLYSSTIRSVSERACLRHGGDSIYKSFTFY